MVGDKLVDRGDRLLCGSHRVRLGRLADAECKARRTIGLRPAGGPDFGERDGGNLTKEDGDGLSRGVHRAANHKLLQLLNRGEASGC